MLQLVRVRRYFFTVGQNTYSFVHVCIYKNRVKFGAKLSHLPGQVDKCETEDFRERNL